MASGDEPAVGLRRPLMGGRAGGHLGGRRGPHRDPGGEETGAARRSTPREGDDGKPRSRRSVEAAHDPGLRSPSPSGSGAEPAADPGGALTGEGPPLRIAAHNGAPVWGGAEIALCRLLVGLGERGHRPLLYYNRPVVGDRARTEFGLETRRLHLGGDLALHHAVRLGVALRAFEPDALVVGTFRKLFLAALGGRIARVPRVVARIGLSSDTPRNAKYRFVFRRWVDWIVVNDRELRATYREALPDFPDRRLVAVYKGVEAPERVRGSGALRRELGIPEEAPVIGALARLVGQKRLDRLIRVTARLPEDVRCVVAGEGPERGRLEALARAEGVSGRVYMPGFRDDVGDVLDALDVLVLTSERESLPNAMLEALAAGVPVVSTPVSGAAEALEPLADGRRPGFVVDAEVDAIVRAVAVLLDRPEERGRMADAARERARSRFAPGPMLDRWEGVLEGSGPDRASEPRGAEPDDRVGV